MPRNLTCVRNAVSTWQYNELGLSSFAARSQLSVDVLPELDPPLERAVLDLDLVVAGSSRVWSLTHARDDERRAGGDDPHCRRIDARQLEEEVQRGWIVGAIAVALRLENVPPAREARHLPKLPVPGHGPEVPSAARWQASAGSSESLWSGSPCSSGSGVARCS